jgi:hypothetical protein
MIKPSIGRRVWFHPGGGYFGLQSLSDHQAFDAGVVFVWHDRCVNLLVTDHVGNTMPVQSVLLLQDDDTAAEGQAHATWMPYQVKAAAEAPA